MEDTEEILDIINNNEKYEVLINTNSKTISAIKNDMLQKLQLTSSKLKEMHKKLKEYQYVDEIPDIHIGHYVRWIPLDTSKQTRLTNGGIIVDTKITANGTAIMVKNNVGRVFMLYIDKVLLFQKITPQEQIIINIMDYLES